MSAIPGSEPATAQVAFTVTSSTLSQFASSDGLLCASGINLSEANRPLIWRILKNGSPLAGGTQTCRASAAWQLNIKLRSIAGIAGGDSMTVKLWSGSAEWLTMDGDYASAGASNYATDLDAAAYAIALG